MKRCSGCHQLKLTEEFYIRRRRGRKDSLSSTCKVCESKRWLKRTPKLYQELGFSLGDMATLVREQEGRCAICQQPMARACLDHDHETGAVRGALCKPCNLGLGSFRDDPERLRAAAAYLESSYGE